MVAARPPPPTSTRSPAKRPLSPLPTSLLRWVTLTCLIVILSVVGILSILRLIPDHPPALRAFVASNWAIFSFPVLLLNLSILMFIACLLGVAVYVYVRAAQAPLLLRTHLLRLLCTTPTTGGSGLPPHHAPRPPPRPPQSYRVAIGGFVWACTGFLMLLYLNVAALRRTLDAFEDRALAAGAESCGARARRLLAEDARRG